MGISRQEAIDHLQRTESQWKKEGYSEEEIRAFSVLGIVLCDEQHSLRLTDWEKDFITQKVNADLLTYLGHYQTNSLKKREIATLNKIRALAYKLEGKPVQLDLE